MDVPLFLSPYFRPPIFSPIFSTTPLRLRSWFPPFAKCAKDGAPSALVMPARSTPHRAIRLPPALRKMREGWGTLSIADASEIKRLGHPPTLSIGDAARSKAWAHRAIHLPPTLRKMREGWGTLSIGHTSEIKSLEITRCSDSVTNVTPFLPGRAAVRIRLSWCRCSVDGNCRQGANGRVLNS